MLAFDPVHHILDISTEKVNLYPAASSVEEGVLAIPNGGRVKGSKPIILHQQKQNPEGPIIELP